MSAWEVWRGQLAVRGGGPEQRFHLDHPSVLGRTAGADVQIDDVTLSRRHALLVPVVEGALCVDLMSSSGLYWNGNRVVQPVLLRAGDQLRAGQLVLAYEPQPPTAGEILDPASEVAIAAAGGDDAAPWLVYGDWLVDAGVPRGELVGLQHRIGLGTPADRAALERRERDLLDADEGLGLPQRDLGPTRLELSWHFGFIRYAALHVEENDRAAILLADLLCHPSARFLRGLTLLSLGARLLPRVTPWLMMLLARRRPPLRRVTFVAPNAMEEDREFAATALRAAWPSLHVEFV